MAQFIATAVFGLMGITAIVVAVGLIKRKRRFPRQSYESDFMLSDREIARLMDYSLAGVLIFLATIAAVSF